MTDKLNLKMLSRVLIKTETTGQKIQKDSLYVFASLAFLGIAAAAVITFLGQLNG